MLYGSRGCISQESRMRSAFHVCLSITSTELFLPNSIAWSRYFAISAALLCSTCHARAAIGMFARVNARGDSQPLIALSSRTVYQKTQLY